MTLGMLLRTKRELLNLSLKDVAEACDISKSHIWDLEQGHTSNPSIRLSIELCLVLRIQIEDFACSVLEES